jgi:hypothetical protein
MNISDERIAAVEALGYTRDEARFLYIVATHSGYFLPRQFITFVGSKWRKRSDHFTTKLESRGHATWREYPGLGGVYHLFSRTLYRVIDRGTGRSRRRHSTEFIRTRLVLLDFVLTNQAYSYLETENDKVSFFTSILGIPKTSLPVKAYPRLSGSEPTLRYFPDHFPLLLDGAPDQSGPCVIFCYIDAGKASLAGFRHHLDAYKQLFSKLSNFDFLYVSDSPAHFAAADRCFSGFANRSLRDDPSAELLRYFTLRARWDKKQYGSLSNDDVEWLSQAKGRFHGENTDRLYAAWCSGERPSDSMAARGADVRPPHQFRFTPYLIPTVTSSAKRTRGQGEANRS